ncbi:serine/threonine-protein kinase [Streptomyces mirabilis]|uniref:non-specific serine/threonine protein kinase n=1 Tax=Streptomyces mirabilis TaxID=68239 RepID=A0A1I2V413_9ACTN|nr:serine/threonine-protein kinase [Streptomyces mirabilis]SFG83972.1 Serine/threonine protein kinase [Streptomyces mirabilis]
MANEDAVSQESGSERVIAGRYSLLSPLGAGGMGTVWRAYDKVLHREVAIKEVRAPAGLAAPDIERMYTRLEREAWAAARVAHPNVVTVYDVAMDEGRPWIVMELVRGQSLADLLKAEGRLSPQRAASIGLEVLAALHAAHETGVLHRDVKPANVLMAKDGRVVLTDFGIAMIEGDSALTMTGEVVGSPEFLSPERALGQRSGPASDLWSLGVLLYAAVEARSPFRQNTPLSTLRAIVDAELPQVRRAGALTPVIEGLLRKDPDERLTAEQAEQDLRLIGKGGIPDAGIVQPSSDSPTVSTQPTTRTSPADPGEQPTVTHSLAQPTVVDALAQATVADPSAQPTVAEPSAQAADADPVTQPTVAEPLAQATVADPSAQPTITHSLARLADADPGAQPAVADPAVVDPRAAGTPASSVPPVDARRSRRSIPLVAAGVSLCVLALAGVGYALMNDGNGNGSGDRQSAGNATARAGSASKNAENATAASTQGDQGASATLGVRVTVTGSHTTYSGQCPPPSEQAPTFTATFSVDRLPAQFSYRWVSKDGSVTDPHWRTLVFSDDGGLSKQDTVSLSTWAEAGKLESEIGVELKAPLHGKSNTVPLSLTCEAGTG